MSVAFKAASFQWSQGKNLTSARSPDSNTAASKHQTFETLQKSCNATQSGGRVALRQLKLAFALGFSAAVAKLNDMQRLKRKPQQPVVMNRLIPLCLNCDAGGGEAEGGGVAPTLMKVVYPSNIN